jgi:hypothetical protein
LPQTIEVVVRLPISEGDFDVKRLEARAAVSESRHGDSEGTRMAGIWDAGGEELRGWGYFQGQFAGAAGGAGGKPRCQRAQRVGEGRN